MADMMPIDRRTSTQWAIARVLAEGFFVAGRIIFDLVNVHTVRAHRLILDAVGISGKPPFLAKALGMISGSFTMSGYKYFTTSEPVSFADFDGAGARWTSASAAVYSRSYLTVYHRRAYLDPELCSVTFGGLGLSIPGGAVLHGIAHVHYGDGRPIGVVETVADIDLKATEEVTTSYRNTAQDYAVYVKLPSDVLFDFDKADLKPAAGAALAQAAATIRSYRLRGITVRGYTDGIGSVDYNLDLSKRRAAAVAQWLTSHGCMASSQITVEGRGKADPVQPNQNRDGSDNPRGRAQNRRVEVVLHRV